MYIPPPCPWTWTGAAAHLRLIRCYFRSSFYADQHKFLRRQFFNHEDTQVQIVDAPWPESGAYGAAEMAENEKWSAGDTAI